jgi:hypothetical protein
LQSPCPANAGPMCTIWVVAKTRGSHLKSSRSTQHTHTSHQPPDCSFRSTKQQHTWVRPSVLQVAYQRELPHRGRAHSSSGPVPSHFDNLHHKPANCAAGSWRWLQIWCRLLTGDEERAPGDAAAALTRQCGLISTLPPPPSQINLT